MCDEDHLARWARDGLNRRQFGALSGLAALAACAPKASGSGEGAGQATAELSESNAIFATADGTLDGFFVHPTSGKAPAVLFWPDIAGLREAKRNMARRLAGKGYAVFVANPYYRDVKGEQFADFADFAGDGGFNKVKPWREKIDAAGIMRDVRSAVAWLDQQDAVDASRKVGTQGYCMTGGYTILGAAAAPERIGAAASFHGGGLVNPDDPMSEYKLFGRNPDAHYLIAIAQNDDAKAPGDKTALRESADAADVDAEIEVYAADHGWTVPDSPSYNEPEAERAWANLLELYDGALA